MRGFRVGESNGKLHLSFDSKPVFWERFVSQLIKDKVILDLKNATAVKNELVYTVYNLWKFLKGYKRKNVVCDLTLLRYGVFSPRKEGELFETYGHVHRRYGEVYKVLKNSCFLMMAEKRTKKAYLVELKEGESFLVQPHFMHRLIAKDKDCLVAGFTIKGIGHNYGSVKGKGFPFHLFKKRGKILPVANVKYKNFELKLLKNETKFDGERLFYHNTEKLARILKA